MILIGPLQRAKFEAMAEHELEAVILDANKQMDAIAFSSTRAADDKRTELLARRDFCSALLRKRRGN